jgi:beta-glucosidase
MGRRSTWVLAAVAVGLVAAALVLPVATAGSTRHSSPAAVDRPWLDRKTPIETRVQQLLSRLTLAEKVRLMYGVARPRGVHSVGFVPGIPRLGVPPLLLSDGPVGVKDSCFGEQFPDNCKLGTSTALPATVSLAASFDPTLAHDYGRIVGAESRARGVDVLYGPAMNIVRIPQGGRNFEYFSEDPYLTGSLATAWVRGLQTEAVAAQVKHFALNNQENDRHAASSDADERTMREIYLPAFQEAVTQGGADSLMCANNPVNGVYNCQNTLLLRQILAGEWGWGGVVGSDYAATNSALGSVNGGLDEEFTGLDWGKWYSALPDLVRQGQVSGAVIDTHVRRILRMMFKLGMFDPGRSTGKVDVAADGAFSRSVAERGSVLLKNDAGILPLDASSVKSVAVVGQYADTAMTGGKGSSKVDPYYAVSPVQGITKRLGASAKVTTADGADPAKAAALAKQAQVAVVVVNDVEQEGTDRPTIDLPGNQNQLVAAVRAANPRTVVVLNTGSAVTMPWLSQVHALLEMWYPGEEDGNALAALLFGDVDPAGRLPVTFPTALNQDCCHTPPRYPAQNGSYAYTEGLQVGYRWYDAQHLTPLFPFGFGLSYTTFRVSDISVSPTLPNLGNTVRTSVLVTNTGTRSGTATPQVYLGFPAKSGEPPRRLVATARVPLSPGESKRVTLTVPRQAYSLWNSGAHNWDVASGDYTVWAGTSSRDLPVHAAFQVRNADGAQGIGVKTAGSIVSGRASTLAVTMTNSGGQPLLDPQFALRVPVGWTATTTGRVPSSVPPHTTAQLSYRIGAPAGAGPGTYVLTAHASWRGLTPGAAARSVSVTATAPAKSATGRH